MNPRVFFCENDSLHTFYIPVISDFTFLLYDVNCEENKSETDKKEIES